MAKKFVRTLMLIILLDSLHFVCFSQSNKEQFTLQLFIDQDTLYSGECLSLSFCLSTNCWLPRRLVMDLGFYEEIATDKGILSRGGIYLNIKHKGDNYEHLLPPIINRRNPYVKHWISKTNPIVLQREIPMNHIFVSKEYFGIATEENYRDLQNDNYGEYELQGVYVSDKGDTIVSNVRKVLFMP